MSEIAAAERRLAAALDRIDFILERGTAGVSAAAGNDAALIAQLDEAQAENARLQDEIAALNRSAAAAPQVQADTQALTRAGQDAARLAAANEALADANRALIAAQNGQGDGAEATAQALEAEIEALRAARAAEVAQLADIVAELERLLGAFQPAATVIDDHSDGDR